MEKRKWTAAERQRLASGEITGAFAGPKQSYPIAGPSDVGDAWGLAGHADNPDKVRRRIISIARKYGWLSGLPASARQWAKENGIRLNPKAVGNALKAIAQDDDWLTVENHIVLFGDEGKRDLVEEYFDGETDLESDYTRTVGRLPLDFEHGLKVDGDDAPGRNDILGYTDWSTAQKTDHGWLVQSMLDRRNKYVQAFEPLIQERMIGTSSEAATDGVQIEENGHIRRWPLKRNSLTVEPCEPGMLGDNALTAYKALKSLLPNLPDPEHQEMAQETMTADLDEGENVKITIEGEPKMTEEVTYVTKEEFAAVDENIKNVSEKVDLLLEQLVKTPAAKGKTVAPDSEADHPEVKSFGDFLIAVANKNHKRIAVVYKTAKDLSANVGIEGGVLVPEEYVQQILQVAEFQSGIMQRVRTIPTTRAAGTWPAIDQYFTPTAGSGQTAFAGGAALATVEAGAEYGEGDVNFTQLKYRLNKVGRFIDVEQELMDDSPFAIETLLRSLFGIALGNLNERNVLRGTGAGQPLGILNWVGAIGQTPATNDSFTYPDAHQMVCKLKKVTNNVVWIMHPSLLPDVYAMESSGGGIAWLANFQQSPDGVLLGYPILRSEHLPQADNSGGVILADLGVYLFWQKQSGLTVAYSEHVNFKNDLGTWKFSHRNDGKPWFKDKITLADPQGSFYVSPFIYHND